VVAPPTARLPEWLRKSQTHFVAVHELKRGMRGLNLHTVCESARCPNIHECFHRGTATFMILGDVCTRGCGFCAVPKGKHWAALDPEEPAHVARMAASTALRPAKVSRWLATAIMGRALGGFQQELRSELGRIWKDSGTDRQRVRHGDFRIRRRPLHADPGRGIL